MVTFVALTACGGAATECLEPLSPEQCESAVQDARAFVAANADLVDDLVRDSAATVTFPMVWEACGKTDAPCRQDFAGRAFVSLADAAGHRVGHLQVCIEQQICGGEAPQLGFP